MLKNFLILVFSLVLILVGAKNFTNGIEWLGRKLGLGAGAVGSILAALGTALPEIMIPVMAIVFGRDVREHTVGIGAILGAPFMLGTVAFFVVGLAVVTFKERREDYPRLKLDGAAIRRDLTTFLISYTLAILAAFLPRPLRPVIVAFLFFAYGYFLYMALKDRNGKAADGELEPLYLARRHGEPALAPVMAQVIVAFAVIILGARLFVHGITYLAMAWHVPALLFALLVAPVATELPEVFNSVLWIGQEKDTIALGNVTGAMVLQSSVIPALGIALTEWELTPPALLSAAMALLSGLLVLLFMRFKGYLVAPVLLFCGVFYLTHIALVLSGLVH